MAVLFAPSSASADRIEFIDGRVIICIILRESPESVTVRKGDGSFVIPRSTIERIVKGTEVDNLLVEAGRDLRSLRFDSGLDLLARAVARDVSSVSLAAVMVENAQIFNRAIAGLTSQEREDFRVALDAVKTAVLPGQVELLQAQVIWRLELDDVEGAGEVLARMEERWPAALRDNVAPMAARYDAKIDLALDAADYSRSLELLIQYRKLNPERAGNMRGLMMLEWASKERLGRRFDKALQIYEGELMNDFPLIARERIAAALADAEAVYRGNNQLGRAVELYDRFGMKHVPNESKDRLTALLLDLGRQSLLLKRYDSARQAFWRCERLTPKSAARDLLECDYHERKAALAPDDAVGHFNLGEWCLESGLHALGREAFEIAAGGALAPELRGQALAKVRQSELLREKDELGRAFDLYDKGLYVETIARLRELRRRRISEGTREQAGRLTELARQRMVEAASRPMLEAEILRQQGERAFLTRDYERAFSIYMDVIDRYKDTPAASRASLDLAEVRKRVDVARLERARGGGRARAVGALPGLDEKIDPRLAEEIRRLRSAFPDRSGDR